MAEEKPTQLELFGEERSARRLNVLAGREAKVAALYESGMTAAEIGARLGTSTSPVYKALRLAGVAVRSISEAKKGRPLSQLRRRCAIDEGAFDEVNEFSAYWVGMLMADGCVHVRGTGQPAVSLSLSLPDIGHVEEFRRFLKSSHAINVSGKSGESFANSQPSARLCVVSTRLADALARFGVGPRKSLTARVIGLEGNRHFWRGAVDGDGSLCAADSGGRPLPVLSLAGSLDMMGQFRDFVLRINPGCGANVNPHGSIYTFVAAGEYGAKTLRALYGDCRVALPRKLAAARELMGWTRSIRKFSPRGEVPGD